VGPVVVAVVLVAAGSALSDPPTPPGVTGARAAETSPQTPPAGPTASVPEALSEVAGSDADLLTFVAEESLQEQRFRLWRVDLRSGALTAGPVVPPIRELRLHPDYEDTRLAFVAEGGGLFSLRGFEGSRPRWVAGEVSAFNLAGPLAPLVVRIGEPVAPGGPVSIEVRRIGRNPRIAGVGSLDVAGVRWVGRTTYVWGSREGVEVLVTLDRRGVEEWSLPREVLDVAPHGLFLLAEGESSAIVATPEGRPVVSVGVDIDAVAGWSPDGTYLAVVGSLAEGVEGLWLVHTPDGGLLQLERSTRDEARVGFSSGGRLVFWSQPGAIAVLDVATGSTYRIQLPPTVPRPVGPFVAG
jgi:hypothetical protein